MEYSCYLIYNTKKCYIGSTNNLKRRLRQHNGEIKGGAKSTKSSDNWSYLLTIEGFKDRSEACKFESLWKKQKGKENRLTYGLTNKEINKNINNLN